ncbi:MAG TPA: DUF3168 domain-containing protein [Sphingopyxis sp.]|nr:DUF3168 domain-containing protein [Sphingopyxis sp.]
MADLATALRARLLADTAVAAVVATRIYWAVVPQGAALPYVRLHIISDPRPEHLKGYQSARRTRVQASCFAPSFGAAKQLGTKIVQAVDAPWSVTGGRVGRVKAEGPREGQGTDTPKGFTHHQIVDLMMEHTFAD